MRPSHRAVMLTFQPTAPHTAVICKKKVSPHVVQQLTDVEYFIDPKRLQCIYGILIDDDGNHHE